jgi:exonuclease 3'-5' domain-containing protein 1
LCVGSLPSRCIAKYFHAKLVQVVHSCGNDSAALFYQCGVLLNNVFDTQAAHAVLQQQDTDMPAHAVNTISLNALCKLHNAPVNDLKKDMKKVYIYNPKYWTRRPLTQTMICYAAADVLPLHTLHTALAGQIKPEFADLLAETCLEHVRRQISESGQMRVRTEVSPDRRKEMKERRGQEKIERREQDRIERIEIDLKIDYTPPTTWR